MNLGQMLLVVLALALLATAQLMINSSILRASLVNMDSEARVDAISIAQATADEINSKSFDSATVSKVVHFLTELTPTSRLGREARLVELAVPIPDVEPYQSKTGFDDIDDYNNYSRIDTSFHLGPFQVKSYVSYADPNNPTYTITSRSWYKKITVVVKHPNMVDSVVVHALLVYREFF
jgi:hypothetical protein